MSFFNKREEVINIQLTRFGRETLMKGKLQPVYYRFFDDGTIYDSSWAGFEEAQNDSADRIKEAPVPKPQSAFVGVETALKREYDTRNLSDNSIDRFFEPLNEDADEEERIYTLRNPLYTGKLATDSTPSFLVRALSTPFSGSLTYSTGSGENIPQAKVDFQSVTLIEKIEDEELEEAIAEPMISDTAIFRDGTAISTAQNFIVFSAEETNVVSEGEGFEVEIYEEVSGSLVPMYFEHEDESRLISEYFTVYFDADARSEVLLPSDLLNKSRTIFRRENIVKSIATDPTRVNELTTGGVYTELPSDDDVEPCD